MRQKVRPPEDFIAVAVLRLLLDPRREYVTKDDVYCTDVALTLYQDLPYQECVVRMGFKLSDAEDIDGCKENVKLCLDWLGDALSDLPRYKEAEPGQKILW